MTTLLLVTLAASAIKPSTSARTPAAAVRAFYEWRMPQGQSGLPNRAELEQLRPFISRRLYRRFERAVTNIEALSRRYRKGDKLPCGEGGDWFDSLAEWPNVRANGPGAPTEHFQVSTEVLLHTRTWKVPVRFWFDTTPRVEWSDTVIVIREDGKLVIDDVIYSGVGLYNRSGTLSRFMAPCETVK
jgi:hypothetical protein